MKNSISIILAFVLLSSCEKQLSTSVESELESYSLESGDYSFHIRVSQPGELIFIVEDRMNSNTRFNRYSTGFMLTESDCYHVGTFNGLFAVSIEKCGSRELTRQDEIQKFWYLEVGSNELIELKAKDIIRVNDSFQIDQGSLRDEVDRG